MRIALPILLSFVSACFDAGTAPLTCSIDAPACPDSYVCINSHCELLPDLSAVDPDLASSDLAGDLSSQVSGCAKGDGLQVGDRGAWLCPGMYGGANPKAASLCRGSVCADTALFTAQQCKDVKGGFYASSNWGSTVNAINPQLQECGARPYNIALFGCGIGDFAVSLGCGGFVQNMQISAANKLEAISPFGLQNFTNTNPLNGVICCP